MSSNAVLVVNAGSSSVKLGIFAQREGQPEPLLEMLVDLSAATMTLNKPGDDKLVAEPLADATPQAILQRAVEQFAQHGGPSVAAVGHRMVHGGPHLWEPQRLTAEVLEQIRAAMPFAPLHLPTALAFVEATQHALPQAEQVACFDTAFHRTLPELAARLPLPLEMWQQGVRRYGFHGLSYESIVRQLGTVPPRTVIAHLGNGASLAALREARSVDTSMGLTPLGGIPMGTRSGDLDPGVLLYLLRQGCTVDALEQMLEHESGLKGLSGGTSDMRSLLTAAGQAGADQAAAQLAVDAFCQAVAQRVAAYAVVLGGLDLLVFTGGIGEHSWQVREQACKALGVLGVEMDAAANRASQRTISAASSAVRVEVLPSQEDCQIARHVWTVCANEK